jgi:putative adenylate-forming enzyme
MMMENLSDYNTLGCTKEELIGFCMEVEKSRDFSRRLRGLTVALSSGTSGNKGIEILTRAEENFLRALFLSRYPLPHGEKINLAVILRVSAPALALDKFGHQLTYISQLSTLEHICDTLQRLQPNIVSAPPSMLQILAKEAQAGRLTIRPDSLISYAEILYPDVKAFVESAFHCNVNEIYKCTEGAIAISCRCGRLHLNEDVVMVQLYDREGNPTPPGQACHKMVVTDLFKKSQPIIRYELNDIIILGKERCPCGSAFRVIEQIQGRSDDLFWGKRSDQDSWQFIFPDYICRAIISSSEDIEEYQAIQQSPREVLIQILPKPTANKPAIIANAQLNLRQVFIAYGCIPPDVNIVFEKPKPNPNSLKLTRVRRQFEIDQSRMEVR